MIDFELSEEQRVLQASVREMCERLIVPNARRWDEEERFPHEIVPALGEMGLLGMQIPEAYGGAGMWYVAALPAGVSSRCTAKPSTRAAIGFPDLPSTVTSSVPFRHA